MDYLRNLNLFINSLNMPYVVLYMIILVSFIYLLKELPCFRALNHLDLLQNWSKSFGENAKLTIEN